MPDQEKVEDLGGTLRLGSYPCVLQDGSLSLELFGKKEIQERHRHRYEVNNAYREELAAKGMTIAGTSPDGHIVEMIEIPANPFFVGTQGHPEFKSRPNHAHPLFRGFIKAAADKKSKRGNSESTIERMRKMREVIKERQGLYRQEFEHDNCGIGAVVNIKR